MATAKAPRLVQRNIKIEEGTYYELKVAMAVERTSLQKLTTKLLKDWLDKHPVTVTIKNK